MIRQRLTILLSGMIAADPFQGGATWAVLQYLLGLQRLGHDVVLIEPVPPKSLRPHNRLPRLSLISNGHKPEARARDSLARASGLCDFVRQL